MLSCCRNESICCKPVSMVWMHLCLVTIGVALRIPIVTVGVIKFNNY